MKSLPAIKTAELLILCTTAFCVSCAAGYKIKYPYRLFRRQSQTQNASQIRPPGEEHEVTTVNVDATVEVSTPSSSWSSSWSSKSGKGGKSAVQEDCSKEYNFWLVSKGSKGKIGKTKSGKSKGGKSSKSTKCKSPSSSNTNTSRKPSSPGPNEPTRKVRLSAGLL